MATAFVAYKEIMTSDRKWIGRCYLREKLEEVLEFPEVHEGGKAKLVFDDNKMVRKASR